MDLSKLDTTGASNEGFEVELFSPQDLSNTGIFITVLGRDSDAFRRVQQEQNKRRLAKVARGGSMRSGVALDELEKDAVELLVTCTKSWRSVEGETEKETITVGGKEMSCSKENATLLYTKFPWVREQVDSAVLDRANFIRR